MALVTNNISGSAQGSSRIGITGSVVIGDATDLAFPVAGADVSFFVSGSDDKRSVFGGALVISGALHVEGNSYIGNSAADALLVSGASSIFVSDVIVSGSLIAASGTTILGDDFEITGTFGVSGSSTFSGGSVTILGPEGLSIDGANLDVTGSATVSGNLTVSVNTVISGTLKIFGDNPGNLLVAGADGEVTDTTLLFLDTVGTRLSVTGTVDAMTGFSGSLTTLTDGTSYLIAGSNVTITSASNGAVTISASGGGGGGASYFDSTTSGSIYTTGSVAIRGDEAIDSPTDKGSDVFFYVSGSTNGDGKSLFGGDLVVSGSLTATIGTTILGDSFEITGTLGVSGSSSFSGDVNVTGSVRASSGLSGSLTQLTDGTSYIIAGTNVTVTSASNGAITISSAGGGGGGASYFDSTTDGALFTTGSLALIGAAAGVDSPADIGSDVFFYVSGSLDRLNKSVFGGDVRISGTLGQGDLVRTVGAGSHAEGSNTVASGSYSHAEGENSLAVTSGSHAEGIDSIAGIIALTGDVVAAGILTLSASYGDVTSYFSAGTTILLTDFATYVGGDTVTNSSYDGMNTAITGTNVALYRPGPTFVSLSPGLSPQSAYDFPDVSVFKNYAHAEGSTTWAVGGTSHAEGNGTIALGDGSHAEGFSTTAYGTGAHAEGASTSAVGAYSHAAGNSSTTLGEYSYAGGEATIASGSYQHVIGKYNKEENTVSLFVVGDGTGVGVNRSDILRVNSGSAGGLGRVEVTGSFASTLGLSGSLTTLTDGTSYLIAGSNVTITSASNGAVTISSTGGGGGGASYFDSTTAGAVFSTGSLALVSAEAGVDSPSDKGADVFFYVSGSSGTNSVNPYVSLFGGDVVVSGSRLVNVVSGTGGGSSYTVSLSDHLVVFTSNNVTASLPSAARVGTSIVFKDGTGAAGGASGPQMISSSAGRIDGSATFTMPNINYTSVTCVKVNTSPEHWVVI